MLSLRNHFSQIRFRTYCLYVNRHNPFSTSRNSGALQETQWMRKVTGFHVVPVHHYPECLGFATRESSPSDAKGSEKLFYNKMSKCQGDQVLPR